MKTLTGPCGMRPPFPGESLAYNPDDDRIPGSGGSNELDPILEQTERYLSDIEVMLGIGAEVKLPSIVAPVRTRLKEHLRRLEAIARDIQSFFCATT